MKELEKFQTVDEFIVTLQNLSKAGKGDYVLECNDEYWLARKEDKGIIDDKYKQVTFGGYC